MDDPTIQHPQDVILRGTSIAMCGSDLHTFTARKSAGWVRDVFQEKRGLRESCLEALALLVFLRLDLLVTITQLLAE